LGLGFGFGLALGLGLGLGSGFGLGFGSVWAACLAVPLSVVAIHSSSVVRLRMVRSEMTRS